MAAEAWDTVVIGSGPGGLTAAVALARAGMRVLVLEQHYLPGGWMHSFTLEGHRFSPGVHYIGNLQPGGGLRRLYETFELTGDLEFCEMNPDAFDHILIGDERIDQPKGLNAYKARLKARFPHEAAGIDRYFTEIVEVNEEVCRVEKHLSFPDVLTLPLRAPRLMRWGLRPLASLLNATIRDPLLRGFLSAQCGNHGLPPSRVSLPLHASMTRHYFDGAFYPRGGAKRIPAAYIKALRRRGGRLRTSAGVRRIRVERGRAVGVELDSGEKIDAGRVVCNADPAVTYGRLLEREHCAREVRRLRKLDYSVATVSLFCGVEMDLRRLGLDSGNYWSFRHADVESIYARCEEALPGDAIEVLFLTVTSLKDPGHGPRGTHTVEMFTFVPYEPWARWSKTETGSRSAAYDALKRDLADKMLAAAEQVIPRLRENLTFLSVGSPLTNDFYCRTHRGGIYGTAKTPFQVGPFSFNPRGPVEHLYLCGASTLSHGIAGATLSGLVAAQHVLGLPSYDSLVGPGDGSLRVHSSEGLG